MSNLAKPLTVKNDLLFKKVFGSPRYAHILVGFLKDILQLDIEEVTIENPYDIAVFRQELTQNKVFHTEVDLVARLQDQTLVTIELQINPQLFYRERSLYYLSQKYISNYGRSGIIRLQEHQSGAKYSSLYPAYGLNILDFNLFPDDLAVLRHFTLYERDLKQVFLGVEEQPLFTLSFFELQKQPDKKLRKQVQYWLNYFNKGTVDQEAPAYLQEAVEVIKDQNLEEEEKMIVDALEKAREDYKGALQYAEIKGLEQGREEGIEQGKAETVKRFLAVGMDWEVIMEATGLTKEQLIELEHQSSK